MNPTLIRMILNKFLHDRLFFTEQLHTLTAAIAARPAKLAGPAEEPLNNRIAIALSLTIPFIRAMPPIPPYTEFIIRAQVPTKPRHQR